MWFCLYMMVLTTYWCALYISKGDVVAFFIAVVFMLVTCNSWSRYWRAKGSKE